ncbi:MAG: hypothetical protein BAA01_00360 [Bacillus thermozeamaize]|uniref:Stage VI sporulation protein F n=1 Tax=Bacillus thermozeamaize TaxID=230954 RepID=A0A1Y3Q0J3_9BACI|nr:MAG: hypothetical protein BAA01_00360 [Bacillus thermozeamaize]
MFDQTGGIPLNLRDINRILDKVNDKSNNSLTLNDLLSLGSQFNEKNITDERKLHALIQKLGAAVGRPLSEAEIRRIIGLVKQNKEKLKDPKKAENLFKRF